MKRSEARFVRKQIVNYGTRANLNALTPGQHTAYDRARMQSRDAMRHIGNDRADTAATLGVRDAQGEPDTAQIAVDHDIPIAAERLMIQAMEFFATICGNTKRNNDETI